MRRFSLPHLVMIAPAQALVILTLLVPALWVLWLAFHEASHGVAPRWVGLGNFSKLLADPYFWRALVNTMVVVGAVVGTELVLGLAMALLFAGGVPARRAMVALVLAPYAISEVSAVVMWRYLLDPEVGIVSKALGAVGLPALEWAVSPAAGLTIVALLSIWLHLPFTFVILYSARLAIPQELYESAVVDGGTPFQRMRAITLPLLMPAILVALLFRTIFALRLFSEVWLLTGGGPARTTEVLAVYLYLEAFRYHELGLAAATGWLMVLVSMLVALGYMRSLYKRMFAND